VTRRSALFTGLAVLIVLLGGQVIGGWNRRPAGAAPGVPDAAAPAAQATAPSPPSPPAEPSAQSPAAPAPDHAPGTAGQPPVPRRPRQPGGAAGQLAAMGVKLLTGNRGVALTFDDGPHPYFTPQILTILRAHQVKAVFCVIGTEVRRHPRIVAQIVREGHTLCNHSWHHEMKLGTWPAAKMRDNLRRTNAEIRRAVPNARIPYFRQPGGLWTPAVVAAARGLGMMPLGWSVDPKDWTNPPASAISTWVLAHTAPGSVVLLHDAGGDRASTVTACRGLVPALKRRYSLVPLR
jgi:peptidoglycan/xylan/chitin deacetylase (PgdA/CDA1 family)